jgi:acetyl esterase/lipase
MIRIIRDIAYAEAGIGHHGIPARRMLHMDAYLPAGAAGPVPALVLAFGGAFHRGSKEDDCFPTAGRFGANTAMAEYCRRFAADGLACFSIDYRLAADDPDPGRTPVLSRPEAMPMGRIDQVREIMGLPPISAGRMALTVEAAIDDMAAAARAVAARAGEFGVDRQRIVLGGWSAGGRAAAYAAYAEGVPCAGVLSLSGLMQPEDIAACMAPGQAHPPLLMLVAEEDVPYLIEAAPAMVAAMRERGCDARLIHVPGRDHWYAAEAATDAGGTVQQVLRAAVRNWTGA